MVVLSIKLSLRLLAVLSATGTSSTLVHGLALTTGFFNICLLLAGLATRGLFTFFRLTFSASHVRLVVRRTESRELEILVEAVPFL